MRIYLTGFMGSGKSTVGRLLSEQTGFPFIDLDKEIE
jgi:shikimate kinase